MQTIIFILILFLISIFSIFFYFKTKKNRLQLLLNDECPSCHEKKRIFTDTNTNTTFSSDVISSKILTKHGCSGIVEIEFSCKNCGLKEIHTSNTVPSSCI